MCEHKSMNELLSSNNILRLEPLIKTEQKHQKHRKGDESQHSTSN